MKSDKRYVVLCLQQDDSWREVFSSSKREKCIKYMNSYKNQYRMKLEVEHNSYKRHHGFDYDID